MQRAVEAAQPQSTPSTPIASQTEKAIRRLCQLQPWFTDRLVTGRLPGHDAQVLERTQSHYWGVVLEAPDARDLAQFYVRLLGWKLAKDEPGWAAIIPPDGVAYLGFQTSPEYERPVWPPAEGRQQMMMHLDLEVGDLDAAVAAAIEVGATLAEYQPQERVRVLLDPVGHPFCLYVDD